MQQILLTVTERQTLKPALWQMTLRGESLTPPPRPGQFYLAQCAGPGAPYLRRAIFPVCVPLPGDPGLQILLPAGRIAADSGLAWLASRRPGERVDALGPLGRGFTPPPAAKNLLLAGSGPDVGPLLGLAHRAVEHHCNVILALQTLRAADLPPTRALPPAVEVQLATADGSRGHRGDILTRLEAAIRWADAFFAVGDARFYRDFWRALARTRLRLTANAAQALVADAPLNICGTGVCGLCATPTAQGTKLACLHGPVFDLSILFADA